MKVPKKIKKALSIKRSKKVLHWLHEKHGFEISYISVNSKGMINLDELKQKITKKTILITVMHANNVNNEKSHLLAFIHSLNSNLFSGSWNNPTHSRNFQNRKTTQNRFSYRLIGCCIGSIFFFNIFHFLDAAQSVGKINCDVSDLGVDMLSIAGHKLYAPVKRLVVWMTFLTIISIFYQNF